MSNALTVKVWGDFACFTRPEMKVERVSYPVMTPSAARGILEAIFWKPEFSWQVREIAVLKPVRHFSILRNETKSRQKHRSARVWLKDGGNYYADTDRTQRHTLALRDVAYTIRADIVLRPHADAPTAKYRDQFRRRVKRGQCFSQPFLGCREFAAGFGPVDDKDRPIEYTDDLGLMLFDLQFEQNEDRMGIGGNPVFFHAKVDNGVLRVPTELYKEVT